MEIELNQDEANFLLTFLEEPYFVASTMTSDQFDLAAKIHSKLAERGAKSEDLSWQRKLSIWQ